MGGFKQWLQRIGNSVHNFFSNVWETVQDWWTDGVDWMTDNVPQLIEIGEKLKSFFKGPVDNMVLSQWLGLKNYGNVERIIQRGLERVLKTLKNVRDVNACLDEGMTDAEKVDCLAAEIKGMINAGDEGKWVFSWAKEALTDILEKKGVKPNPKRVESIIQGFYDSRKVDQ